MKDSDFHQLVFKMLEDIKMSNKSSYDSLKQELKDGFDMTHKKQDHTNGRLLRAEDDIRSLKASDDLIKQAIGFNDDVSKIRTKNTRVLWYIITTLGAIISALMGYISAVK